jgi:hypothetical protein
MPSDWMASRKTIMSARSRHLKAEFGPETRFEVQPAPPAPFRAGQESRFERLKSRLLTEQLRVTLGARHVVQVRRAANEAAALSWVTPYPLLVFPVLFDEKAKEALLRLDRQERVRERTRELSELIMV